MADHADTFGARCPAAAAFGQTPDLNWLLHRAAQHFGEAMGAATRRYGIGIRGHIVLTALAQVPGRPQLALGAALGLDKTTLTTVLDRLESDGLVVRRPDPRDRRVRIPEVTDAGRELQEQVASALREVEHHLLRPLREDQRTVLRSALWSLVKDCADGSSSLGGSCI